MKNLEKIEILCDKMVKRNSFLENISENYLFVEINNKKKELIKKNPKAKIISLGIGNTTQAIPSHIASGFKKGISRLENIETYTGYGDEIGFPELKEKIAKTFYSNISGNEVFISDGAKCDVGRLQVLFGSKVKIAVQDPVYPAYVDGSVLIGSGGKFNSGKKTYDKIQFMPCLPENDFFPDLSKLKKPDLIFFCSPNNPTGAVASKEQLKELIDYALDNKSIIIFDAAYSSFIRDKSPKSIFEINNAEKVAIETNSFSKSAGFTGIRLGWTVVPKNLEYENGKKVISDWNRIMTTLFNGASNIVQYGGLNSLDEKGLKEIKILTDYYLENAKIIKQGLDDVGIENYGNSNSPYVWARMKKMNSWQAFDFLLNKCFVVTTPGSGFGPSGENFLRFSAFGKKEETIEAIQRIKTAFLL